MRPAVRRWLQPALALVVLVAAYAVIRGTRKELTDFVVPRLAATRFLAHESLYRPEDGHFQFKYLPAFAAAMIPFALIPKEAAEAVWFALSVAMAAAFVGWAVRALPDRRMAIAALVWWTLLLNAKFLIKEVGFGQFNLLLAALFWGAIAAGRRGRWELAGALLGASVFVKPYGLVLLPWMLWQQPRRTLVPFGVVLASGLVLPAVAYGWNGNVALLHDWYRTVTDTTAPNLGGHENISLLAMWARWLPVGRLPFVLATASAGLAVAAGLYLIRRRSSIVEPMYLEGAYFSVLIPLVSPQGWDYVMLLALPAYTCLVDRWRDTPALWRAITAVGFLLTSFATYELMRRTVYFAVMDWGGGSIGAILIGVSLLHLRFARSRSAAGSRSAGL